MQNKLRDNILTPGQLRQFFEDGYLISKHVFRPDEVADIRDTFMDIQAKGAIPGYFEPASPEQAGGDPLKLYPRILYPHRVIGKAKDYMLHPKVLAVLGEMFGEEPLAAQSMFYYKPPGARGQALHQDNYYLRVEPGTCIAAWVAIDPSDEENGGLAIVPKTQESLIQCPHSSDPAQSFSEEEVDLPEGSSIFTPRMEPGDVLFFNGSTIHGSYPNRSKDRFRRSFICHYVGMSTARAAYYLYDDLYNSQGERVRVERNESPGPCGTVYLGEGH